MLSSHWTLRLTKVKTPYLQHVDNWFFKSIRSNNIELILKTTYLHFQDKQI
jgi:hypothetical protein